MLVMAKHNNQMHKKFSWWQIDAAGQVFKVDTHHQVTPIRKTSNQVAHQMYTRNFTIGVSVTSGSNTRRRGWTSSPWDGKAHNWAGVTSGSNMRKRVGTSSLWDGKAHNWVSVTSGSNTRKRVGIFSLWDGKAHNRASVTSGSNTRGKLEQLPSETLKHSIGPVLLAGATQRGVRMTSLYKRTGDVCRNIAFDRGDV